MAATQALLFQTLIPEIRNHVYKYLSEDALVYMSATRLGPRRIPHYTPAGPIFLPTMVNDHRTEIAEFPVQLALTCTQLRTEYLPVLLANTDLRVYGRDCNAMVVLSRLPPAYRAGIHRIATLGHAACGFDAATFALLPALASIEYNLPAIDWYPDTMDTVTREIDGTAHGSGLIEAHRDSVIATAGIQDFLFLDPAGVPPTIKVTVGFCSRIRLQSKHAILLIRGSEIVPEGDDQECVAELRYDWRTGELVSGMAELEKAREEMGLRFEYDVQMDAAVLRLNSPPNISEADRDHLEWEVDSWNNREGYCYVAEGREWAWREVVKEMAY